LKTNTLIVAPIAFMLGLTTFTLLLVNIVATPQSVYGQTPSEDASTETVEESEAIETIEENSEEEAKTTPVFEYVAVECDTLTHLVRRSVILFDEANDDISLSQEAIIYAETNIVRTIGPRLLAVGENVSIDSSLVEMYAESGGDLTEAQVAAWKPFTANVNFDTERIQPTNNVEDATKTETQRVDEQAQAEQTDGLSEADTVESEDGDDEASALWWVAGGGAVAGLWYLLYRRNES